MDRRGVWVWWLLSRAALVLFLLTFERMVLGDVAYYRQSFERLTEQGISGTLIEYPVPGVVLVGIPWLFSTALDAASWYAVVVATLALATDAAFLWLLGLARGRAEGPAGRVNRFGVTTAELAWLLAPLCLGATVYARFDLVPGVLIGLAVLYASLRPGVAAGLAAAATSLKYWPFLVLPALAAPRGPRRRVIGTVAVAGGVLAGVSVLVAGWSRQFSPMVWQSDRGLQIESLAATPAMLGWSVLPESFRVEYTDHNAYEVFGPPVDALLRAGELATVALVVLLGVLWWRSWRMAEGHPRQAEAVVWVALAAVTGFICTSKVFSPQYLLWVLPAAAAACAVASPTAYGRLLRWAVVALIAAGLTHVFYPLYYAPLLSHGPLSLPFAMLLTVRNLLVLWLAVEAVRAAFAATSAREADSRAHGTLVG